MKNSVKYIDTLEKWNILSAVMRERNYRLWQMQYGYDTQEGFHAWFNKSGKSDVEVVTFNKKVQDAIIKYTSVK
jgi:hypothetical protein